ncbi:hypothetical protein TsFJ059_001662 [Trichoderma semiorbis]|uniref:Uncharacterized protein n=1 Tax=Trichoderma semiorbis TaxID=1491008 RepID=A0A9P8KVP7_9HYPO|nr:hypothetical protein TsFJ059_001662 [Trichoderma semiorbis]
MASALSPDVMSIFSAETAPTSAMSTSEEEPPFVVFTTIKDLFEDIGNVAGDTLVVTQVSPRAFEGIYSAREAEHRKFRCSLYTAETQMLIITIPTLYHEAAHQHLQDEMSFARAAMGLRRDWLYGGSATFKQMAGDTVVTSGEGDSVGGPKSMRPSEDDWPTLVVEVGFSQTLASLRIKAYWWFSASNYEVKIVLLVKLNGPKESILIEQWTAHQPDRHGATMTRAAATLRPRCIQSITITRDPTIHDAHPDRLSNSRYVVQGGPLRLAFTGLFLRQPTPGSMEGDMIINDETLREIALATWRVT